MSRKNTSPFNDQQTRTIPSVPTKIIFRSGVPRKLRGASLARDETLLFCDECGKVSSLTRNNEVGRSSSDMTLLQAAAHDLRHPAAAILIYSELLTEAMGQTASEEQREWIDSIHSVSQFMLRLLDDTFDFASQPAGTSQLHTAFSTVATVVEQSVKMSRPLAARKQICLTLVEDGEPVPVLLNAVKIGKVFNNLIENAIKYCPPGARIDVRISRANGKVMVAVQDNGPGMDPSRLDNLFIPFRRARAATLSGEQGTGLGLAIAKHIVDLHGGKIRVESQVGKGTTFYVSLPAGPGLPNTKKS